MTRRPRLSELVKKHRAAVEAVTGACTCHEAHTSRDLIDPSCRFHECGEDVAELLDRIEALEKALREVDALLADDLRVLALERIERALEAK